MAGQVRIVDLNVADALIGDEEFPLWQNNQTKKVDLDTMATALTGGCNLQCATLNLTSAQMLALNTTPIIFVPAPGANKAILAESCWFLMRYDSVAYVSGGTFQVYTDSDGAGTFANAQRLFGFPDTVYTDTNDVFVTSTIQSPTNGLQTIINRAIYVTTDTIDAINGNSEASLFLLYREVDLSDVAS